MASVVREVEIAAAAEAVWDAVRDYGALHVRVAPGLVTDTQVEAGDQGPIRVVTFANDAVMRERIIAVDEAARRLVWSIPHAPFDHHNGALQVIDAGEGRCRAVWTADMLPDALAEQFAPFMEQGMATLKATAEAR